MTPQQIQAIKQFMAKPKPQSHACCCVGPQLINPATAIRGEYGMTMGPRYPLCPCAMNYVETVEGRFYRITEVKRELGYDYVTEDIGGTGGNFRVTIIATGVQKINVIKLISEVTNLTLFDAKHLLSKAPVVVYETQSWHEAESVYTRLTSIGATAAIQ